MGREKGRKGRGRQGRGREGKAWDPQYFIAPPVPGFFRNMPAYTDETGDYWKN